MKITPETSLQEELAPQESNKMDPRIVSTEPEFNSCPAYLQGICRISGRPCVYNNQDKKECGIYNLAATGDPNLWQIPFGRENETEYISGIKS